MRLQEGGALGAVSVERERPQHDHNGHSQQVVT